MDLILEIFSSSQKTEHCSVLFKISDDCCRTPKLNRDIKFLKVELSDIA